METRVTMKYVAPEQSTQDAVDIYEFTLDPDTLIPTKNQVVTLPVERPGGFGTQEKDFRVVDVLDAHGGFVPATTHRVVHIFVRDVDE